MTRAIMFQGTGSDVGKTVLVAGLCRVMRNRGLKVRPFKPQNMSNNAAVTDDGGEIGRGQWLQALACGVPTSVHMNPVLLKPQSETGSQIIVQGKVRGQAKGRDYQRLKPQFMDAVMQSWQHICDGADIVLVEGAGSPAEINLRKNDIANMGFATKAGVPVVLVGDIDRGGVIASLVGTHTILPEQDRAMIAGFLINKFRGDVTLFDDGLRSVTEFTGWPSFGVVPWLKAVARLPAEDSVGLERMAGIQTKALKIAVPMLDRIANFDDLDPLKAEPDVEVVMVRAGEPIPADAGLIIVPGTKSTIGDLKRLRENGWDAQIHDHVKRGGHVIGICGGYQMLGQNISDPEHIDGDTTDAEGLGLLQIETVMKAEKTLGQVQGTAVAYGVPVDGYEIHCGVSHGPDCARPFALVDGRSDGAVSADGRIFGTYLHGLFASDSFRAKLLAELGVHGVGFNYRASVDDALNELAENLEQFIDVDALLQLSLPVKI
ncbi:adenosylcobyric acid synthase [Paenochrobactrum gallinarii]|uniref:Cobyric acid synthase n=1 Tax=Paenochrobactrum gallinarii TaxID=643673 RepID=A0A841LP40_9HYPH|nr:cobyric acid synthase [Paenochrobactrum gallinarii]MBB6259763.1 adenosylcobyric acid synthase [Paenochrobactrum gallinarii]